jgi:filamentous hemagglutinin family protein
MQNRLTVRMKQLWQKTIFSADRYHSLTRGLLLLFLVLPLPLKAQVIGDNTLPSPSEVTFSDNTFTINGGTTDGRNLFHSFNRFDLLSDTLTAFFNNTSNVENIFARVTGGSISRIDGQIRADGAANLFLINPSGIIFGPNATLNIGGSFIGSTADSILFANGGEFSAIDPQAPPLLTVNIPIGLTFRLSRGVILVQGTGHNLREVDVTFPAIDRSNSVSGLRVNPGKTLGLIGGKVELEGSTLTAEGGHVELGSIGLGLVSLSSTASGWNFGYERISSFNDIELTRLAAVDVSGPGGGSIQIQGDRVKVSEGSFLVSQTEGDRSGGDLTVKASKSFEVAGTTPDGMIPSTVVNQTLGDGRGGNLLVSTQQLLVRDGGLLTTRSLNDGSGGNILLNVSESVVNRTATISAVTQGAGNAGNLSVFTKYLQIQDSGRLGSAGINLTIPDGGKTLFPIPNPGSVGEVTVNATESVQVIGGSTLGSLTFGTGNAGKLTINTRRVEVREGGRIDVATFADGDAGRIDINASESVEVSGRLPGSLEPSLIVSSAEILDEETRAFYFLPDIPTGNSGSVTIPYASVKYHR